MAEQLQWSNSPDGNGIHKFLDSFGLVEYESRLIEAGLENFQILNGIEENDIDDLIKDANIKESHIEAFKNAINAVKNGTYHSNKQNKQEEEVKYKYRPIESEKEFDVNAYAYDDSNNNKTIIFIGESGVGKTTIINSMCNYLYKVKYNDNYRYRLIDENINENKNDETQSQTQNINKYYLNKSENNNYALTIIDTPGFGTNENDTMIQNEFKKCFKEIKFIDAIYFVIKSTDSRLSDVQKYIIKKLLNLFDETFQENIFILFTFSDGSDPPALKHVNKLTIKYNTHFKINNSGFTFPHHNNNETHKMYFNLGIKQFGAIFAELDNVKPKSTGQIIENIQIQMKKDVKADEKTRLLVHAHAPGDIGGDNWCCCTCRCIIQ